MTWTIRIQLNPEEISAIRNVGCAKSSIFGQQKKGFGRRNRDFREDFLRNNVL